MAMGTRKRDRQPAMWVATTELPTTASHPFYARLNELLSVERFDDFAEARCEPFYAETMGRPGLAPGIYFRLLMIGYFEGLDSERGIAWRAADSLTLRDFLGLTLPEAPPDHSTISRTRRLIDVETHQAVFTWVLERVGEAGLVKGKTIGVDATTLEANAALRSIVRRDSGESYDDFLTKLAQASGIETPMRADLARLDRKRKKKGSNDDWTSPADPDAKITKMKEGRTHLAPKPSMRWIWRPARSSALPCRMPVRATRRPCPRRWRRRSRNSITSVMLTVSRCAPRTRSSAIRAATVARSCSS